MKRPLPHRALGFVLFVFYFLRALVLSNLELARVVLFAKGAELKPGFLTYSTEGLSKLEVFVLSQCITLTPGTTTVEISPDFKRLTLHSLDARDPSATVAGIRRDPETPMTRWTR